MFLLIIIIIITDCYFSRNFFEDEHNYYEINNVILQKKNVLENARFGQFLKTAEILQQKFNTMGDQHIAKFFFRFFLRKHRLGFFVSLRYDMSNIDKRLSKQIVVSINFNIIDLIFRTVFVKLPSFSRTPNCYVQRTYINSQEIFSINYFCNVTRQIHWIC